MEYLYFAIIFLLIALVIMFFLMRDIEKRVVKLEEQASKFKGKAFLSVPLPVEKNEGVEFLFLQEARVETKPPSDLNIKVHDDISTKERMGG